jgi:CheY-like chemotaxis protein
MNNRPRLLFVDDEQGIRMTLPAILELRGFTVATAATVAEALNLIASEKFDVLISDLNIGEPGDGFTVVSAMRRTQPDAPTFILTGYPAFETALEAIRQQVDDYLIKPADVESLVANIQEKLAGPKKPARRIETKRLAEILNEEKRDIIHRWLASAKSDGQICSTRLSDHELTDHLPAIIDELITSPREQRQLSATASRAAQKYGRARFQQGCAIPSLIREARILHEIVSRVVEKRLLEVDVSSVINDVMAVGEILQAFLEECIRAHVHARHALMEMKIEEKSKSVLLLSADPELSLLRAFVLERGGYSVARAGSRKDALQLLDQPFDALVTSHSMSAGNMAEMTELFRQRNPNSPVIGVIKGKWQDLKIELDFTVSGDDGPEALLESVETALNRKQLRRIK